MDVLPLNFKTLESCGMWSERGSLSTAQWIQGAAVLLLIFHLTLCQMIELFLVSESVEALTEVLFMTLSFFALCLKLVNFLGCRTEMHELLRAFRSPAFRSGTPEEAAILASCAATNRTVFLDIMALSLSAGAAAFVPALLDPSSHELPFKAYQLIDLSFWAAYALQLLTTFIVIVLNVSMDTMTYGFIALVAGQLDVLACRLRRSSRSLRECLEHHLEIQETVARIQDFFMRVIVPLFCFSFVTLCTTIFQMSKMELTSFEFLFYLLYLSCMLCQIFFYCWFGNELALKNETVINAIYSSQWLDSSNKEKKNLWFIMLSAQSDNYISFHGQFRLTINTFILISKTSYTIFNLLKRVSV